jgi:hypothetical protein
MEAGYKSGTKEKNYGSDFTLKKRGYVRINVTSNRIRVAIVTVEWQ